MKNIKSFFSITQSLITILLILISLPIFSQDFPPIVKYPPILYSAGNQNWMITQDKNNYLFFANNEGLLEYNGSNWTLYPSPNETIIRSVKVIGDCIFTGCYMEFGYWKRQNNGRLKYFSLSKTIKNKILDDEQFWSILTYDQWVLFQSLNRIYIYDTIKKTFSLITPKSSILKSFKTDSSIYYQTSMDGFFEIENGKSKLISNSSIFLKNKIVGVFNNNEELEFLTQKNGFFKLSNNTIIPIKTTLDTDLQYSSVYSFQKLANQGFVIGTISNGIFITSRDKELLYHITQDKGLSNNTALSLFEDIDNNLWIGLDNGINCINLQSPIKSFSDNTGILGTVYASTVYKNKLYIGTNQGLFYKSFQSNESFQFVSGTKGQVWSLFQYQDKLFCGHDSGTFLVDNGVANNIFSQSGTWKFETMPGRNDLIFQGNYFGISVLKKENGKWIYKNKLKGFDYSSRYFELTPNLEFYVSHEYKGIFRFHTDKSLQIAQGIFTYKNPPKGKNASLVKYNNTIYYAYKQGVFKLNPITKSFIKDSVLSDVFKKGKYTTGKLIVDKYNKLWFFTKNYINYFTTGKLSTQLKKNIIPIPASLTNSMLGYENISQLTKSIYLIGTTDGYYTLNLNDLSFKNYSVSITSITKNKLNQNIINTSLFSEGEFSNDENNLTFNYSVPEYNKYINPEYQYLLKGIQDDWSDWNSKTSVNFKNLPPGSYVFKVRAKIANTNPKNIVSYKFTILKPWYTNNFALLLYFLLAIYIAYFINKTYKVYYQRQREKLIEENNLLLEIKELENNQQLMKLKNEQLTKDVDSKSKELAVSTMNLIKKNELLSVIKEDLKKTSEEGNRNIKSVISTINKNIKEEDNWNIFREAFDTADKDFLKKVKSAHPSLTPNDLRLCAYLRLNLSSKEVAPLLNISVRSVEIKRYRLRKKMDLPHEQGLVEYILSI
ncbi:triple tyrosine motif-containing protein [Flavobacterium aciduliphilum]|uniref:Two component regulator with propeller domain n=1 Tax=Flavobacterium aciduliphilum TaxID=1101402 RepID=A0A328YLE9_9FLAO|nr:triple tyrosine motif-containing protein [Flavobacterium aciduliphilum]RAR72932.1 two component regulator with propeller domain [Flavobacterium aciduliphilum]